MTTNTNTGRRWAYTGIILGGAVSIAANVAHSYVPPTGAPATWHPHPGAVFGAIVWPVFLFVAIEILIANRWPNGARYWVLRFGGLLPVATVAAIVSYRHLSGLLAFYGEDHLVVTIGPAAVDGLMAMATGALYAAREHTTTVAARATSDQPSTQAFTMDATAVTESEPVSGSRPEAPAHLVSTARFAVTNHEVTTGQPITADELAARMSIGTDLADRLLARLRHEDTTTGPEPVRVNGTPVLEARP